MPGIYRNVPMARAAWTTVGTVAQSLTAQWANAELGDRLICCLSSIASNPTFTTPAGWTSLGTYKPTTTLATAVFYRDYTVYDPTPVAYNWQQSAGGQMTIIYVCYQGCDLTVPPLVSQNNTLVSSRTANAPAITMADSDRYLGFTSGRQNPGDAGALSWSGAPYEWYDFRAEGTSTNPQLTTVVYDMNDLSPAGNANGSNLANKNLAEVNNWSIRLRAATSGQRAGIPIR